MKNVFKLSLVVIAIVAVALFSTTLTTYAQGPVGGGPGGMMGGPDNSLVAVAAQTLGVTQADLVAALQGGKTIADVAKDKGVALDKIVDAFIASRQSALKTAVSNGRLAQAQADSMISLMKTNILARLSQPFTTRGMGFTDTDNDGVCDNCGMMNGMGQRRGTGRGRR